MSRFLHTRAPEYFGHSNDGDENQWQEASDSVA